MVTVIVPGSAWPIVRLSRDVHRDGPFTKGLVSNALFLRNLDSNLWILLIFLRPFAHPLGLLEHSAIAKVARKKSPLSFGVNVYVTTRRNATSQARIGRVGCLFVASRADPNFDLKKTEMFQGKVALAVMLGDFFIADPEDRAPP